MIRIGPDCAGDATAPTSPAVSLLRRTCVYDDATATRRVHGYMRYVGGGDVWELKGDE